MKIGIVGSRSFPQLKLVEWFIQDLPLGLTVISGGAVGVDSAAIQAAKVRGLQTREILPDLRGCTQRHEFTRQYYARNQRIVDESDLVIAFTEKDRGGTWDTIKRAQKANKPLKIIRPSLFFPGDGTEETEAEAAEEGLEVEELFPHLSARAQNKGKGPFAIKRVSLGSYAVRRKCYIEPEEWAAIVCDKDDHPDRLADKIVPAMVEFFRQHNRLGILHAVTVPPRSKRNLHKPHVMDLTAERVARELGVEWVRLFQPWEKATRGRHARHGEISVLPDVARLIGRVVWVLDDVTTTNLTLRSAVASLQTLEIHSHGLAYVVMG